ncbi:hypothetical protein DFH09DRAFT_1079154 [Mycena vulgaris]|nr:hypothetical protein DFH09DRAFT_1079154 [Mycena vulgaris]
MAVLDFNKRGKTVENRNRLRNAEPPLEEVLQRFSQAVPVLNLLLTNLAHLSSPHSESTHPLLLSPPSGYYLAMGGKPKRAATILKKAKDVASIAAEEDREVDEKPPPKKRGSFVIPDVPFQELVCAPAASRGVAKIYKGLVKTDNGTVLKSSSEVKQFPESPPEPPSEPPQNRLKTATLTVPIGPNMSFSEVQARKKDAAASTGIAVTSRSSFGRHE